MQQGVMPGLRGARSGGLDSSQYSSSGTGGEQEAVAAKGKGPRIYVGGIPTAVSETMVRGHFNQWGQVLPALAHAGCGLRSASERGPCWKRPERLEACDGCKRAAPFQQCTMTGQCTMSRAELSSAARRSSTSTFRRTGRPTGARTSAS